MKITVEHYDSTYTVECSDTIENYVDAVRGLASLMGYHQNTIDQFLPHWEHDQVKHIFRSFGLDVPDYVE